MGVIMRSWRRRGDVKLLAFVVVVLVFLVADFEVMYGGVASKRRKLSVHSLCYLISDAYL